MCVGAGSYLTFIEGSDVRSNVPDRRLPPGDPGVPNGTPLAGRLDQTQRRRSLHPAPRRVAPRTHRESSPLTDDALLLVEIGRRAKGDDLSCGAGRTSVTSNAAAGCWTANGGQRAPRARSRPPRARALPPAPSRASIRSWRVPLVAWISSSSLISRLNRGTPGAPRGSACPLARLAR